MGKLDVTRRGFVKGVTVAAGVAGGGGLALGQSGDAPGTRKPLHVRFGLNLLVYTAAFTKNDTGLIDKVAGFGYDGVEILFGDLDVLDAAATRKAREQAGIGLTACAVMTPEANIISGDAGERAAGLARLKRIIDITAEMGGDVVAGPLYAPVRQLPGRARTDAEWQWAVEGLRAAAEYAAPNNITLAFEPLNRFETYMINVAADAVRLARDVDHPHLKVQFDTFHAHIEERDSAAAIKATGAMLGHFHASENDRGVPGSGQVRWEACFDALRAIDYRGWVTIESFAMGIVDLCAAACIWRPIYDSADALARDGLAFLKQMAGVA